MRVLPVSPVFRSEAACALDVIRRIALLPRKEEGGGGVNPAPKSIRLLQKTLVREYLHSQRRDKAGQPLTEFLQVKLIR